MQAFARAKLQIDICSDRTGAPVFVTVEPINIGYYSPFKDSTLMLGTWQQIVFLEMDINKRERNVILQIMGK